MVVNDKLDDAVNEIIEIIETARKAKKKIVSKKIKIVELQE